LDQHSVEIEQERVPAVLAPLAVVEIEQEREVRSSSSRPTGRPGRRRRPGGD
jgi:hypothetical protein